MALRSKNFGVRVPPQNIEAEQALLGAIMLQPDSLHEVSDIILADSFYAEKHRIIWKAMSDLFAKGNPIDVLSLSTRLKETETLEQIGGSAYLAELTSLVPSSANVRHYAEIVRKKHTMRNLISASERIQELGYDEAVELDDLLDGAEKHLFKVTNVSGTHKFIELKDALHEAWERLDRLHRSKDELRGVPTGFKELDSKLSGLQKSDLIILAARPSMGKTSLALDIARQVAVNHKVPVGIFSLEMSSQQLVDRMLAAQSRVDAWKLRTGRLSTDAEFDKLRDSLDQLAQAPIYIDDQPGNTIIKMRAVARRLKTDKQLGLIVVDYLQLMLPSGGMKASDSFYQQVTEISRSLKNLAREIDVPVLALSQLSRAVEARGGKPRLSDLRDSGCLSGDTILVRADTGARFRLRELVGKSNIPVFAIDEKYQLKIAAITKVFPSGLKEIFQLTTRSGRTIKASENHPFLTLAGWERLDKLSAGRRIALPRELLINPKGSALIEAEIILLAHLLGDGCVLPKQPIHYTSGDPENIRVVSENAQKLFGITPRLVRQKNWWHLYLPSPYRLARGRSHPVTVWYRKLGLSAVRSYKKCLPEAMFVCSASKISLFLKHLWATDGNISWKLLAKRKPAAAIYYSSTSVNLAQDVQHLLLRLGIWSTLKKVSQGKYRPSFQVHIQGSPMQLKFLELVGSAGGRGQVVTKLIEALRDITPNPNTDTIPSEVWSLLVEPEKVRADISWREVASRMGTKYNGSALFATAISRERLTRVSTALKSHALIHLAESGVYWDEITSISPCGFEEVYDATVPGAHNFIANDFIVHNSIEQDADVVMFIHREDKYNENSDKPNIAEIMIEKHRNGPTGKVELYFDADRATFLSLDKSTSGNF